MPRARRFDVKLYLRRCSPRERERIALRFGRAVKEEEERERDPLVLALTYIGWGRRRRIERVHMVDAACGSAAPMRCPARARLCQMAPGPSGQAWGGSG